MHYEISSFILRQDFLLSSFQQKETYIQQGILDKIPAL